jgi:hypothetical protein
LSARVEHTRLVTALGWYLIGGVAYQLALWVSLGDLTLYSPRFGLFWFSFVPEAARAPMDWLIIAWQSAVAITCLRHRPILKAYVVSETVFLISSAYAPASILITGGADMFHGDEGALMLVVLIFCSVVPLIFALSALRRRAQ